MKTTAKKTGLAILFGVIILAQWAGASMAPKSAVSFGQALMDAEAVASTNPDWEVARVEGESMAPFFGEHSILVYGPEDFSRIQPGMTVVFDDGAGDLVAHRVLQLEKAGLWTRGTNNFRKDPALVTEENFRGVVIAVFHAQNVPVGNVYASDGESLARVYGKSDRG